MAGSNPPAFPALSYIVPADLEARHVHRLGETQGMTLRDYLAAAALPAVMRSKEAFDNPSVAAEWAYQHADAMLVAREAR